MARVTLAGLGAASSRAEPRGNPADAARYTLQSVTHCRPSAGTVERHGSIRMSIQRLFAAWLCLAPAALLASPKSQSSAPPRSESDWAIVEMQGQRCGHMHSTQNQVGDEMHTRTTMTVEIERGPAKIKITMDQRYRETMDGKPLGFESEMLMGQMPVKQKGTVADGKITLVTDQMGATHTNTYDFDPECKFAWGLLLEQRERGIKPGMKFTVKTYEPSVRADGPVEVTFNVEKKEKVDVRGTERELFRVTSTLQMQVPVQTTMWVDEEAKPFVTDMNLGFMKVRIVLATKEEALKTDGVKGPEMFFSTFVAADKKIPDKAKSVVLKLTVPEDGDALPDMPTTGMQTFRRVSDHEATLTIRRLDWKKLREITTPKDGAKPANEKTAEYLKSSAMVNTGDARIKRLAKRAVKDAKTPAEQADALRKYVTTYVKNKGLDVGFATASEVAKTRAGDCSEHAVLLAALARVAGLPSRGVSGIVQIPWSEMPNGAESAFGYHMWTQVYIDGQWVDIDAAMRQTDCDPTHIALSLMPLNDEALMESMMSLLPLMGRLEIEVVTIED